MNISELKAKIIQADWRIKDVLRDSGYLQYGEMEDVEYDSTDPEQAFLATELQRMLSSLDYVHSMLQYIQLPIEHEGILHMQPNGRYHCDGIELTCGSPLEILITNDDGGQEWVASRLEANSGYYFVAKPGLQLEGQKARIRKRM